MSELNTTVTVLRKLLPLNRTQSANFLPTATDMAGALWQMAAPGTALRDMHEADPELVHAVVDVGPTLTHILTGLLKGYTLAR